MLKPVSSGPSSPFALMVSLWEWASMATLEPSSQAISPTMYLSLLYSYSIEISLWRPIEPTFRYRPVAECQSTLLLAHRIALLRGYRTKLIAVLL